ncbi:AAA family ATPase [Variovorax paradoxus]|uniref:AAA family ATPase n=1 Tax=Variovorax paradoxus TaxID=34073 RepID=UPI003ECD557B
MSQIPFVNMEVSRFVVHGLHGKYSVDIPIKGNRLVLVGVNGLGKTTVVNLIYYLLTTQWLRLLEVEFASLAVVINDEYIEIERGDIQHKCNLAERYDKVFHRQALRSGLPMTVVKRIVAHPNFEIPEKNGNFERDRLMSEIAADLSMPRHYVRRFFDEVGDAASGELFESNKDRPAVSRFLQVLKEAGRRQVIYLPTFRRIEQDLKSIFPNLDEEGLKRISSQTESVASSKGRGHVELVQFGMGDVEAKIGVELDTIQKRMRTQLTNLAAAYLKDIISNKAENIEINAFADIDDRVISYVLNRVEENTLSQQDKFEVKNAIDRIRQPHENHSVRDKYLANYFSRLLDIYSNVSAGEYNIRRLVETCNEYLERKELYYDDTTFSVVIRDVVDHSPINWKVLSSGEKQVASLFTHLYLSHESRQVVIIDEPELSLSVQWQKRLLQDISNSPTCELLVAVTHSPFIYANELDEYAIDLSRCIG